MTTIAIIDDHSVVRFGLRYLLRLAPEMELVAEGATADDAVRVAEEKNPDVMLLDVRMPGPGGIDALGAILAGNPTQKVLMLTTSSAEEDVFKSVRGGARGYVLKDAEPDAIIGAIREVAAGGTAFPPEVMRIYEMRANTKGLSPREREILQAAAKGLTNQEIAAAIGTSVNTVKMHLRHIYDKMEVTDRTEAVAEAVHRGIL